ncbi:hypothetical protein SNK03_010868 [Fusarium graminearum]
MSSSNGQAPMTTHNVALTEEQIEMALHGAIRDATQKQYAINQKRREITKEQHQFTKARRKVAKLRRHLEERRAANSAASDPLPRGIMGICQDPETLARHAAEVMAQPGVVGVTFHVERFQNETEAERRV